MHVINRSTEYAALSLLHIAKKGGVVSAQELAEMLALPHPFLRRILGTLQKSRIIRSQRGQKGGFVLARPPETISLLDIITVFQGKPRLTDCTAAGTCLREIDCQLRPEFETIEEELSRRFGELTVLALLTKKEKHPAREKEKIC